MCIYIVEEDTGKIPLHIFLNTFSFKQTSKGWWAINCVQKRFRAFKVREKIALIRFFIFIYVWAYVCVRVYTLYFKSLYLTFLFLLTRIILVSPATFLTAIGWIAPAGEPMIFSEAGCEWRFYIKDFERFLWSSDLFSDGPGNNLNPDPISLAVSLL